MTTRDNLLCVEVNKPFPLQLYTNGSTGYEWTLKYPKSLKLEKTVSIPDRPTVPGSGATVTYWFVLKSKQKATIRAVYARPWEKKTATTRVYQVIPTEKPKIQQKLVIGVSGGPLREKFVVAGETYTQEQLVDYIHGMFPRLDIRKRATKETNLLLIPDSAPRASDSKLKASSKDVMVVRIGQWFKDIDYLTKKWADEQTKTERVTKSKKRTPGKTHTMTLRSR